MKTIAEIRVALFRRVAVAFADLADSYQHAAAGCLTCRPKAIAAAEDGEQALDSIKALAAIEKVAAGE
jgi:hypothetical protein